MADFLQKILLFKETTAGVIPTSPKCYAIKAESFGITAPQASETNQELGNGRGASSKTYGELTIGGDMGMIWNTDNAPILFTHGIGVATTTAAATAVVWATSTVYAKGDKINHTDGKHTLVCYKAGTSGAVIPSLVLYTTEAAGRGIRVTDGTVIWTIMPKLYKQTGVRGDCLLSFGAEVKADNSCGASSPTYTRYTGLHVNSLPFSITGTTNSLKSSVGVVGMAEEDSLLVAAAGGTYEAMSAKVGFTEVDVVSDYYQLEDCSFYLDNVLASVKTTSFDGTITNNVSMESCLNKLKSNNIGTVEVSGSFGFIMDNTLFAEAAGHVIKSAKFVFTKANGCSMTIEFPQFKFEKTFKEFATDKNTMLKIPFSAFDTSTVQSMKWETISPTSY